MASHSVREELLAELDRLEPEERKRVLEYARSLGTPVVRGTPGGELMRFHGRLPAAAAEEMNAAIEEGCERVDADEW